MDIGNLLGRLIVAGVAMVLVPGMTLAASFSPVTSSRSISINGDVQVEDYSGDLFNSNDAHSETATPNDFGMFDKHVGLGLTLPSPIGDVYANGQAAQESSLGGESIHFKSIADAFVSSDYISSGYSLGSASASSQFDAQFTVAKTLSVRLTMDSQILDWDSSNFQFSLSRNGTLIREAFGSQSFSENLTLDAGTYTISTSLAADSNWYYDSGSAGRALAEFTISAVPEPGSVLMLLLGFGLVGVAVKRKARRQNRQQGQNVKSRVVLPWCCFKVISPDGFR